MNFETRTKSFQESLEEIRKVAIQLDTITELRAIVDSFDVATEENDDNGMEFALLRLLYSVRKLVE